MAVSQQEQDATAENTRRGREWYDRVIRAKVEPDNFGKACIIDIETGEYEIDANSLAATKRMLARKPEAKLFGIRVGFPTMGKRGGGWKSVRRPDSAA